MIGSAQSDFQKLWATPKMITSYFGCYYQNNEAYYMYFNTLKFQNGGISGEGTDDVGVFKIEGTYETSSKEFGFIKTYPAHIVEYKGTYSGNFEKFIGNWYIGGEKGEAFLIEKFENNEIFNGHYKAGGEKYPMTCVFGFSKEKKLLGKGNDSIGLSVWDGKIQEASDGTKNVVIKKHYVGKHDVVYTGKLQNDCGKLTFRGTFDVGYTDEFYFESVRED